MKMNENKTKGITLVVIVAIMLVAATTVSLTPVASVQASSNQQEDSSFYLNWYQSLPSGEKDNIVSSNDNSANSAGKNTFERDHDVKQASPASERALELKRSIETPNKNIEIDVESNDKSTASSSNFEAEFGSIDCYCE